MQSLAPVSPNDIYHYMFSPINWELELSRVILKAHILTGDDAISKIGTKHASLSCDPHIYLSDFAEAHTLSEEVAQKAEGYLVCV